MHKPPVGKKTIVRLENVSKRYGQLMALDDVSFDIGAGVTGLLGPNGAGKTTLIKVLLGLVSFSSGTGEVLGFDLKRQPRAIRARVGYMPEDDCYIAGVTGIEMVQFAARLSGQPMIEGLRRAHEILDFSGVEQERYRKVDTYSTGMRQKLKFAQAIVHDPPFLILDEPTSGLDPEERQAMLNRISVLARRFGKAVLISTHILPDVQSVCDQVVILARGQMRLAQTMDVLNRPTSPAYHVRALGNAQPLIERISREGWEVTVSDDGSITVNGPGDIADRVWQWSRETGVGIRSLVPSRTSLHQVFLEAVREKRSADS
jgi:ABC-2 type transport system ATP-binding protein